MTVVGNFVLLRNKNQFEKACASLAQDIAMQLKVHIVSVHLSARPDSYPCLMAAQYSTNLAETKPPSDELAIDNAKLEWTDWSAAPPETEETVIKVSAIYVYVKDATHYVYVKDATQLLEAVGSSDEFNYSDAGFTAESSEAAYVPSPIAILLLALINELKSVGAIKKDKLLEAVKKSEHWLTMMQERNEEAPMEDILRRFWEYS
jgi:hypothetical protein